MSFLDILKRSAFDALDTHGHVVDLQGWIEPAFVEHFDALVSSWNVPPRVILEVGSWKGLSATTMATRCKAKGMTNVCIVAIDTWLGAPEFWTWGLDDPTRGKSLNVVNGYPTVFYTFTKNVKTLGHDDVIAPFPISSTQGAHVLKAHGIRADMVYIDGSHEYDQVLSDLHAYWPLLKEGGVLFGDDYSKGWPGVVKAVDEFAKQKGVHAKTCGVLWTIHKAL